MCGIIIDIYIIREIKIADNRDPCGEKLWKSR